MFTLAVLLDKLKITKIMETVSACITAEFYLESQKMRTKIKYTIQTVELLKTDMKNLKMIGFQGNQHSMNSIN